MKIRIKRIYDPVEQQDGCRIQVDRLWPRGISKERASLAHWMKEVAPSHQLRKQFNHNSEQFEEFRMNYIEELRSDTLKSQMIKELCQLATTHDLTLLYAAKNTTYNHAVVLREEILHISTDLTTI
ncbi:DUF488 family protein [Bacillus sp. Bva_UNVM-123]|uniref:DUF488 domain-containing protein n=1 Tax=Bacillus sp. Bva_UNVM-123 TaxID=2829798 RepID=UPI00391FAB26